MLALVIAISATITPLMLAIKAWADVKFADTDPATRALGYQLLAILFGVIGALAVMAQTPNLLINDPIFGNMPALGFIAAGLIATLPGGVGTSLLGLLYPKPVDPNTAQAVPDERRSYGLLLWM